MFFVSSFHFTNFVLFCFALFNLNGGLTFNRIMRATMSLRNNRIAASCTDLSILSCDNVDTHTHSHTKCKGKKQSCTSTETATTHSHHAVHHGNDSLPVPQIVVHTYNVLYNMHMYLSSYKMNWVITIANFIQSANDSFADLNGIYCTVHTQIHTLH